MTFSPKILPISTLVLLGTIFFLLVPLPVFASTYTPIFDSTLFDGVKADVLMGTVGWVGVVVAVAGAALIIKVLLK